MVIVLIFGGKKANSYFFPTLMSPPMYFTCSGILSTCGFCLSTDKDLIRWLPAVSWSPSSGILDLLPRPSSHLSRLVWVDLQATAPPNLLPQFSLLVCCRVAAPPLGGKVQRDRHRLCYSFTTRFCFYTHRFPFCSVEILSHFSVVER